jgi:cell division protein FtsW (lipid II flippase)
VVPLAPWRQPSIAAATDPENPHRLLIGRFDAAFVVVFLVPLFIIALTYSLIAGERERGTLALLLAQPVTLPALITAKLAPRVIIVVALLALIAVLFALAIAQVNGAGLALWRGGARLWRVLVCFERSRHRAKRRIGDTRGHARRRLARTDDALAGRDQSRR